MTLSGRERRQVAAAAAQDGYLHAVSPMRQREFPEALHWLLKARRRTLRAVQTQPDGTILVEFGVTSRAGTGGYLVWSRYVLGKSAEGWGIEQRYY